MKRAKRKRPRTKPLRLPGDLSAGRLIDRILRVDQAGEYGAVRIYAGQLAVLRRRGGSPAIERMAEKEQEHLDAFNKLLVERRVRPTALMPLWHVAGFALGAGSALLGERAAMACTVAVEDVIDAHYASQAECLDDDEATLRRTIERFRKDEHDHRAAALRAGAEEAPLYRPLTAAVRAASRLAIWLSERI